jgi:hypothetical protein
MFTKTKIALSAAIVLGAAFSASAATKPAVTQVSQAAAYDMIPGYDRDGHTVGIPNPDRFGVQSQR